MGLERKALMNLAGVHFNALTMFGYVGKFWQLIDNHQISPPTLCAIQCCIDLL